METVGSVLLYGILNMNPRKELLWSLRVVTVSGLIPKTRCPLPFGERLLCN